MKMKRYCKNCGWHWTTSRRLCPKCGVVLFQARDGYKWFKEMAQ